MTQPDETGSARSAESSSADLVKAQLDFLWKQHSYISDFIKLADAKCGFIASLNLASAAILFSTTSKVKSLLPHHLADFGGVISMAASTIVVCLFFSTCAAIWTVYPRLRVGGSIGPISWIEISAFKNADVFAKRAFSLEPTEAVDLLAKQTYYMAQVCMRKNTLVRLSLASTFAAMLTFLSLVVFT